MALGKLRTATMTIGGSTPDEVPASGDDGTWRSVAEVADFLLPEVSLQ